MINLVILGLKVRLKFASLHDCIDLRFNILAKLVAQLLFTWFWIQYLIKILATSFILAFYRRRAGRLEWHTVHMLCSVLLSRTTSILCTVWVVCTCNNGPNTSIQNVIWLVNTCFAVQLHKPSHNELNQNNFYGVQMPEKLMQKIAGGYWKFRDNSWRYT